MTCELCKKEIKPYQPGTVMVEAPDDQESSGMWHEDCYRQYREDYKTADEIIAEADDE